MVSPPFASRRAAPILAGVPRVPPIPMAALAMWLLAACAGAAPASAPGDERAPLSVGTLDPDALPSRPVVAGPEGLSAYGLTEVPAGARLQAAYVLADALARAELARLVEVRISSHFEGRVAERDGVVTQQVRQRCVESAQARLPGLGASAHGAKTSPDGRTLRVAARIDLPADEVRALLRPAFADAPPEALDAAVHHLLTPGESP